MQRPLVEQMASLGVNSVVDRASDDHNNGAVLALYFTPFLKQYGAESYIGAIVAIAVAREMGPVLTGRCRRGAGRVGHRGGAWNHESHRAD